MGKVREGYKQTKVGVIPEEWDVVKLGEICKFQQGVQVDIELQKTEPAVGYVKFLRIENYTQLSNDFRYIPIDKAPKKYIKENEIAIVRYGATAGFIARGFNGVLANNLFKLIFDDKVLLSEYLYYYLISDRVFIFFQSEMAGGAMPALSFGIVKVLNIHLPPLKEQQKIAQILSTWDDAISKQEELIVAKEQLKIGLMQRLLSGEVRFNGFDGEWEEVKLGDVGYTYGGLTKKTAEDFGCGNAQYITYKNIFDNDKIDVSIFDNVKINNDEKQNKVMYGDVLFTTSSETPEEVGMSSVLLDEIDELYLNSFCFGYRVNDLNILYPQFSRFYFRSFYMRDKISRLAQGSTRFNLSKLQVMKIKIKLPPLKEQQKIAQVLTTADKEIVLLKSELTALKEQKRGLMQRLLTGEVRTIKIKERE